jgi:hypothetical protein
MNQESGLVPCYCQKCKGCPRKKRTERLHHAAAQKAGTVNKQADIIEFADWKNSRLRGHAGTSQVFGKQNRKTGDDLESSSSDSETSSQSSDSSKGDCERPLKRQRIVEVDQVCMQLYQITYVIQFRSQGTSVVQDNASDHDVDLDLDINEVNDVSVKRLHR